MNGGLPDVPAEDAEPEWRSDVLDLSGVSLSEWPKPAPGSALAGSLRRLAAELDDPDEPIAGFNSAL